MVSKLSEFSKNLLGWSTPDKIVVFESDDWGSIRMPDIETRDKLIANGISVDKNYFTRNDRLESYSDMEALLDLLTRFKDKRGKHPVFTTLNIMGNPDFDPIIASDGKEYFWQHVDQTYSEYGEDAKAMRSIWKQGADAGLLCPQFHGREHLNIRRWMRGLEAGLPATRLALQYRLTGIKPADAGEKRGEYQAAFDIDFPEDIPFVNQVLAEGIDHFEEYFGYRSKYFVPTNGPLNTSAYPILVNKGIRFLNTSKLEREPLGNGRYRKHFRWQGKSHKSGLTYLTRNSFFEPSATDWFPDWVAHCLSNIDNAFKWNKPATICTHRVNYVSGISMKNRDTGLAQLETLNSAIQKKWPDVIFMSSVELGERILKGK
jgi:hypothetical protein